MHLMQLYKITESNFRLKKKAKQNYALKQTANCKLNYQTWSVDEQI